MKKIVVIGPESTGKSTLCELLANHFQTKWVAEYAREYLLTNGKEYTYDNLLTIAKEQLTCEDEITLQFPVSSFISLLTYHLPLITRSLLAPRCFRNFSSSTQTCTL